MTWSRQPWRKLHARAVTSASHCGVGVVARSLLLTMIALASWDEESEEGRMLDGDGPGDAMPLEKLARLSEVTTKQAELALAKLEAVGTVRVVDGVVTLPGFRRWQRGESTLRTRAHRSRNVPGTDRERQKQKTEAEADRSIEPLTGFSPPSLPLVGTETQPVLTHPDETPQPRRKRAARRTTIAGGEHDTEPRAAEEPGAGVVAKARRDKAKLVWAWHEGERVRRLCAVHTEPRQPTATDVARIVRLHEHIRRRHSCDDDKAWTMLEAFRGKALTAAEAALRSGRTEYPSADKQLEWCRTDTAWSSKAYDIVAEREDRGERRHVSSPPASSEYMRAVAAERRARRGT